MTPDDTRVALERWYRRLLIAYPAQHRSRHGQEMLAVLLADAGARGDKRPSPRESLDLVAGGVKIRFRGLATCFATPPWRDALAVISLIAPLIMLHDTAGVLHNIATSLAPGTVDYPWAETLRSAVVWLGWPAVLALGFSGRTARRIAALAAAALAVPGIVYLPQAGTAGVGFVWFLMLITLACLALALSPGPRHGLAVLGKTGSVLVLTVATLGFLLEALVPLQSLWSPDYIPEGPWYLGSWALILIGLLIGLKSPAGRRAAALLAAPVLSTLSTLAFEPPSTTLTRQFLLYVLAVLAGPLLISASTTFLLARRNRAHRPKSADQEQP